MSSLSIYLLGAPRIERDGKLVETDTRKATALLAYLAVTGEVHTREELAALLWPESNESRARAALRRTLSVLKAAIGEEFLLLSRERAQLAEERAWVDVNEFNRLSTCETLSELEEAADLYRDDLLTGFTLRDAPEFDDWVYFEGEQLRRRLLRVLERLVAGYAELGRYDAAIAAAQRWLALDPLREEAHRTLMRLYAWAGERSAALQQYRECVRILEEELGVPPLEETTALYQLIQENTLDAPAPRASTPLPQPTVPDQASPAIAVSPDEIPLVGRRREVARLQAFYQTTGPDGRVAAITGEAGIGKTRLAETFLATVRDDVGAAVISVRCYEGEGSLAYAAIAGALRAGLAATAAPQRLASVAPAWLAEAARLVPEVARHVPELPPLPPLEGPGGQSRLLTGLAEVLSTLCAGPEAGVLFVDDAHWADAASVEVLAFLTRRLAGRPLLVLLSWREADLDSGSRLPLLLAEAERADRGITIPLSRLSAEAVDTLVAGSGRQVPADFGRRLFADTEGLPFFIVEYLAALDEAGADATAITAQPMPRSVRDLLHSRLSRVGETGQQLLQTAAAMGRSFSYDLLLEASGRSEEEAVGGLEGLLRRGLITERSDLDDGPTYDFSHEKLRTLVYEETSLVRRRLLHRRLAEVLIEQGRHSPQPAGLAAQVANHYRLAGRDQDAAGFYVTAGDHAASLYANREALEYYELALALGANHNHVLYEACGDLHTRLGAYAAALNNYEKAAAYAEGEALGRLEHKLGQVYYRRGDYELAEQQFAGAAAHFTESTPPAQWARLYADWSYLAYQRGAPQRAQTLAGQALQFAKRGAEAGALAQTRNILGMLARSGGALDEARAHLQSSLALAETTGQPEAQAAALNNLALVARDQGDLDKARALLEKALQLCQSAGDRHREAALHSNLADLLHALGKHEAAMDQLKQSVAIYAEIGREASEWQPEVWKLMEW